MIKNCANCTHWDYGDDILTGKCPKSEKSRTKWREKCDKWSNIIQNDINNVKTGVTDDKNA